MQRKHIAVLMGGVSSEREVSLASGKACAKALETLGYEVSAIDIRHDIVRQITALKTHSIDSVFNALHGSMGEDGYVQALLEILNIPYTHSGVTASVLAFHKIHAKTIMKNAGVSVTEHIFLHRDKLKKDHPMAIPYVLKPVSQGSSVGVFIVDDEKDYTWFDDIISHPQWGDEWMAEPFIAGKELTCGIFHNKALDVIEIISHDGGFYNYTSKYQKGGSHHIIPAEISSNIYQNIQEMSERAHHSLGCKGVTRVDFRYDSTKEGNTGLFCLEVNTQPGMTSTSLLPDMVQHKGMSFEELVHWIINDASIQR